MKRRLKSIVLLKNDDNKLPLSKDVKSIALIGPMAMIKTRRLAIGEPKQNPILQYRFLKVYKKNYLKMLN